MSVINSSSWYYLLSKPPAPSLGDGSKRHGAEAFIDRHGKLKAYESRIIQEFQLYQDMSGAIAMDQGTATYITLGLPEHYYLHKL